MDEFIDPSQELALSAKDLVRVRTEAVVQSVETSLSILRQLRRDVLETDIVPSQLAITDIQAVLRDIDEVIKLFVDMNA